METVLIFKGREQWRLWLEKNHDRQTCVWLTFYKKASGKKGITLGEAVEEAMCFGWIDGKLRKIDEDSFVVRFSPRKENSVWSKINRERAEKLIASGRMTSTGLAKIDKARKSGRWKDAYTNKVRDAVPADLVEALRAEKKAWENFQAFANTYSNMYVGWVTSAKTDEVRRKRIMKIVEQSLQNKKQLFEF
jgi:uncharacterized protein YdeI (YjbR/CyaY-like superfamily)